MQSRTNRKAKRYMRIHRYVYQLGRGGGLGGLCPLVSPANMTQRDHSKILDLSSDFIWSSNECAGKCWRLHFSSGPRHDRISTQSRSSWFSRDGCGVGAGGGLLDHLKKGEMGTRRAMAWEGSGSTSGQRHWHSRDLMVPG